MKQSRYIYNIYITIYAVNVFANASDLEDHAEQNIDKIQIKCNNSYTSYHPEIINVSEINTKAHNKATHLAEEYIASPDSQKYIQETTKKCQKSGNSGTWKIGDIKFQSREFPKGVIQCSKIAEYLKNGFYQEKFMEIKNQLFSEALGKRNDNILKREQFLLKSTLLQLKRQAHERSRVAIQSYENAKASANERLIKINQQEAIGLLTAEHKILDEVNRCYSFLESLSISKTPKKMYHNFQRKRLENTEAQKAVERLLTRLGVEASHIAGDCERRWGGKTFCCEGHTYVDGQCVQVQQSHTPTTAQ